MQETNSKRIFRTKSEKLSIICRQESSGLTIKAFCEQEGIHVNQFYLWKRHLHQPVSSQNKNDFIELKRPSSAYALEIQLPNGIQVRGNQPETILATVTTLLNK